MKTLIGPFTQLITLDGLPASGPIRDEQITPIPDAGILCSNGIIQKIGSFAELCPEAETIEELQAPAVGMPGLIDSHTHICYAGSRAEEYARRLAGESYQEIAQKGGGIRSTVQHTRAASEEELTQLVRERALQHYQRGVTTCEVKSGYGLSIKEELKMLNAIRTANRTVPIELIPTCLAAHVCPPEFSDNGSYLEHLVDKLFPLLEEEWITRRIDIFIDKEAFTSTEALWYMAQAQDRGFQVTCHADQFSRGGTLAAAQLQICSADHLEASEEAEALALAERGVVATVLPGATLGLGMPFAPARMLLDHGVTLAIASDWNPGSAPMGDLLTQAALLGAAEKLSMAETLAGITVRAAAALRLEDRGILAPGKRADIAAFPCSDWREILYQQGSMQGVAI